MISYDEVDRRLEKNKKAQAKREIELQKKCLELSDKMFKEDVSDEECNTMEKRQDEILDEVGPIN